MYSTLKNVDMVRNIYWDMFFGQTLDQNAPKFLTSGFKVFEFLFRR
jgi:hypothetical protein